MSPRERRLFKSSLIDSRLTNLLAIFEHLLALEHRLRETEEEKVEAKEESSKLQADFLETEKKLSGSNRILAHAEVALEILKLA